MKNLFRFIVTFLLILYSSDSYSQTSINIIEASDTGSYMFCAPKTLEFGLSGQCQGYSIGDSIDLSIDCGDGNIIYGKTDIYTYGGISSFYWWIPYTYALTGNYTVKYIATAPDGKSDTLIKVNEVVLNDNCGTLTGKAYIDNNNDCIFNPGDSLLAYIPIYLDESGINDYHISSDSLGSYDFTVESGHTYTVGLDTANYYGKYFLPVCPASGQFTFTASSSNNYDLSIIPKKTIEIYYTNGPQSFCYDQNSIQLNIRGQISGYPFTDPVFIKVNFGDGKDTTIVDSLHNDPWDYKYFGYFNSYVSHKYSAPGTYSVQYIATMPDGNADTINKFSHIEIVSYCDNIYGKIYFDNNNDCIFNSGDIPLPAKSVVLKSAGIFVDWASTDSLGIYYLTGTPGETYNLEVDTFGYTPGSILFSCPNSNQVTFVAGAYSENNFALTCNNNNYDLQAHLTGWGFRPGLNGNIYLNVINPTCALVSGNYTLTLDPLLTFQGISSGVPPTSVSGNTLTWDFTNLGNTFYWDENLFSNITVTTSTSAQIGDSICLTLSISPTAADLNPSNNTIYRCFFISNSWDPNMKEVSPAGIGASGDVAQNTDFTYTVHFQNTGNDYAYNVYIMDTIDANLDLSTIRILSSSHNMNPYSLEGNIIKFDFPNIMLADSISNEPASHGMVVYKIKAKPTLAEGTQIKNTAGIYFDFNSPVITNTTVNSINSVLGIKETKNAGFRLFPNPTTGLITINFEKEFSGEITVTDVLGKNILNQKISGKVAQLDLTGIASGIYTLSANNSRTAMQEKIAVFH